MRIRVGALGQAVVAQEGFERLLGLAQRPFGVDLVAYDLQRAIACRG